MDLSVIIVSYNVSHFLEQAIVSVQKAMESINGEIIIVDNYSVDNSCEMVKTNFKEVILIENKENLGFSKANNIGIQQAKSEFVLILNPDTIVHEECLKTCLNYLKSHHDVGALGIKMLDGGGRILPESKRGFPTAWVSFCKMSGLYKIFPYSKLFNTYYLGHLSYEVNNEVDVLSGAFIFTRKDLLNDLNGFDEKFFMYGEDIDLSVRIKQAGYKLMYLSEAQIIHFKGESTKKSSINYWYSFYSAMLIFNQKHQKNASLLMLLKIAILFKGVISFIKDLFKRSSILIVDSFFLIVGVYLSKYLWANCFYNNPYYFHRETIWLNAFQYGLVWISSFYLFGVYDKQYRTQDLVIASIIGLFFNLAIYAVIPDTLRSSRVVLGLTFLFVLIYLLGSRIIVRKLFKSSYLIEKFNRTLIFGNQKEFKQVVELMGMTKNEQEDNKDKLIRVDDKKFDKSIIDYYIPSEIIVCPSFYSDSDLTNLVSNIPDTARFRILNPSGMSIIGSSDKTSSGQLVSVYANYHLNQEKYNRQKRFFDLCFSLFLLTFCWIIIFIQNKKRKFFVNIFDVMVGLKTWVGFDVEHFSLHQPLKKSVLQVSDVQLEPLQDWYVKEQLANYCRNYSIWMDLDVCIRDFEKLGN